jgi:hypothetical protein
MFSGAAVFRRGFQLGDFAEIFACLAAGFSFYHAAYPEPTPDGPFLRAALRGAREAFGPDFRFTDHVRGETFDLLPWVATIGGLDAEGVDLVREDGDGRLLEVRITMRPIQAIQLFSDAMLLKLKHRPDSEAAGE